MHKFTTNTACTTCGANAEGDHCPICLTPDMPKKCQSKRFTETYAKSGGNIMQLDSDLVYECEHQSWRMFRDGPEMARDPALSRDDHAQQKHTLSDLAKHANKSIQYIHVRTAFLVSSRSMRHQYIMLVGCRTHIAAYVPQPFLMAVPPVTGEPPHLLHTDNHSYCLIPSLIISDYA